jgi:hypothetical protein
METFLYKEGRLTPYDSKKHITYKFNPGSNVKKLNIMFSYEPKVLTDMDKAREIIEKCLLKYADKGGLEPADGWEAYLPVQNLITISLDDPEGFRGAAHRHPPEQVLYLSEDSASPGFIKGELKSGEWSVTISTHAVVTDVCSYKLLIEGEGGSL